jgi:hypothetical protein
LQALILQGGKALNVPRAGYSQYLTIIDSCIIFFLAYYKYEPSSKVYQFYLKGACYEEKGGCSRILHLDAFRAGGVCRSRAGTRALFLPLRSARPSG